MKDVILTLILTTIVLLITVSEVLKLMAQCKDTVLITIVKGYDIYYIANYNVTIYQTY